MNPKAAEAVSLIEEQVQEFGRLLRESPTSELMQRLTRWKERVVRLLRSRVSESEGKKFERIPLRFDDSVPNSFDRMLTAQRSFLTILGDEIRKHPQEYFGAEQALSWEEKTDRVLRALATFEASGTNPDLSEVRSEVGLSEREAEVVVQALIEDGQITGADATTFDGYDVLGLRLLPNGRRSIGQWAAASSAIAPPPKKSLRLFISHSKNDVPVAEALLRVLRDALFLRPEEIRCTSVDGYRLPAGESTRDRLRTEIFEAEAFIALISAASLKSTFVLFELGARWGAKRHLIPLLVGDFSPSQLTGPLMDLNALQLTEGAQVLQLVSDLGETLGIRMPAPAAYSQSVQALSLLNRELGRQAHT